MNERNHDKEVFVEYMNHDSFESYFIEDGEENRIEYCKKMNSIG